MMSIKKKGSKKIKTKFIEVAEFFLIMTSLWMTNLQTSKEIRPPVEK